MCNYRSKYLILLRFSAGLKPGLYWHISRGVGTGKGSLLEAPLSAARGVREFVNTFAGLGA